jgi:rfaE bifunctional protein nucleotidyltransferase chain/domain
MDSKLLKKINLLKKKNKKIVLCHGVFDLVHLGHIEHLKSAKKYGDFLVVSITADKFVKKGIGQPLFSHFQRKEFLKSLKIVDDVIISNEPSAVESIKYIKPDYYVKGPDYKDNSKDKTKKIFKEKKILKEVGGQIKYTSDQIFSSSSLINEAGMILNNEQRNFVTNLKKSISYNDIMIQLKKLKNLNAIVFGELIFDEYIFGDIVGKSAKEPHLVMDRSHVERYIGGSGAIVRHIQSFINKVKIISFFGGETYNLNLIKKYFQKNVKINFFKPSSKFQTITKTRFIDVVSGYKVFGSYILTKNFISKILNKYLIKYFKDIRKYNLVIICDYGHHLITDKILKKIYSAKKNFISINSQINSSNIGFQNLDKYNDIDALFINEGELRFHVRDTISSIEQIGKKFSKNKKIKNLIITRGKNGAIMICQKGNKFEVIKCPAFAKSAVDKVGAGDAMLSITSICLAKKFDKNLALFLGSLAGAISVSNYGNKDCVSHESLERLVEYSLK